MKRSGRIKRKARKARIGHFSGTVRLDAAGMAELRARVYDRARGICEMKLPGCWHYAGWLSGQLAHWPKSRGAGAGDTEAETVWACSHCHHMQHNPKAVPRKPE